MGAFVLSDALQQVYHLLAASCADAFVEMTPMSEGRLQRTGAFRDNQFRRGAAPSGAAGAPPYAADSVLRGCAQICPRPGSCQFGGIRARARHLHQLRQKRKPSARLA